MRIKTENIKRIVNGSKGGDFFRFSIDENSGVYIYRYDIGGFYQDKKRIFTQDKISGMIDYYVDQKMLKKLVKVIPDEILFLQNPTDCNSFYLKNCDDDKLKWEYRLFSYQREIQEDIIKFDNPNWIKLSIKDNPNFIPFLRNLQDFCDEESLQFYIDSGKIIRTDGRVLYVLNIKSEEKSFIPMDNTICCFCEETPLKVMDRPLIFTEKNIQSLLKSLPKKFDSILIKEDKIIFYDENNNEIDEFNPQCHYINSTESRNGQKKYRGIVRLYNEHRKTDFSGKFANSLVKGEFKKRKYNKKISQYVGFSEKELTFFETEINGKGNKEKVNLIGKTVCPMEGGYCRPMIVNGYFLQIYCNLLSKQRTTYTQTIYCRDTDMLFWSDGELNMILCGIVVKKDKNRDSYFDEQFFEWLKERTKEDQEEENVFHQEFLEEETKPEKVKVIKKETKQKKSMTKEKTKKEEKVVKKEETKTEKETIQEETKKEEKEQVIETKPEKTVKDEETIMEWTNCEKFRYRLNNDTKRIQIQLFQRDQAIHQYLIERGFAYRPKIGKLVYQYGITKLGKDKLYRFIKMMEGKNVTNDNIPKEEEKPVIPKEIVDDPIKYCNELKSVDKSDPTIFQIIITILTLLVNMLSNKPKEQKFIRKTLENLTQEGEKSAKNQAV